VFASGALATYAGSMIKSANDIRWLASGPRCGIGELSIPENEPGSSIMPGKVNPTQCEAVTMVAVQVHGNNAAIAFGGSQRNFELNVLKPVIIHNFLHSVRLLTDVSGRFVCHCLTGLEVNKARIDYFVSRSLMLVTVLSPIIGYDRCAKLARYAHAHNLSLREANRALKSLSDEEFQKIVRPETMTKPHEA
jgi:fumarate hydratase class II